MKRLKTSVLEGVTVACLTGACLFGAYSYTRPVDLLRCFGCVMTGCVLSGCEGCCGHAPTPRDPNP